MIFFRWLLNFFKFVWHKVANFFKDQLIIKQFVLVWRLKYRHKQLARLTTYKFLRRRPVGDALKEELRFADEMIIHNIGIMFNRILIYFLIFFAVGMIYLYKVRADKVPLFIKLKVTRVRWQVANAQPTPGTVAWHMFSNAAAGYEAKSVYIGENSAVDKTEKFKLDSDTAGKPLEIRTLSMPDSCFLSLNFADSLHTEIGFEWRNENLPAPVISWEVAFTNRASTYGTEQLAKAPFERVFMLNKRLIKGPQDGIELFGINNWKLQRPVRASKLSFEISEDGPQNTSSIISGEVRLLNSSDSAMVLRRGDQLNISFKDPVEVYLSAEPGSVWVQTTGIATKLECGPDALGDDIDKMPRLLKSMTDESPYLLTIIAIVVPLLMTMIIRQRKSI